MNVTFYSIAMLNKLSGNALRLINYLACLVTLKFLFFYSAHACCFIFFLLFFC